MTDPFILHSWVPIDLVAAAKSPPEPPTIGGLLYPGKRTLLSGETESMKTWTALVLAKAEIDAGYTVGWTDLDAMGGGEILARLRLLGVSDEQISRQFRYYAPEGSLTGVALDDVVAEVSERQVRLFVIDAFNPALSLHGLDPNSTPDVETFWREVAQPICDAGAAPTLLDHVVKNSKAAGKYAYGSERKASGAHVHIGFRALGPFKRDSTGRTSLATHKDRPGFLPRPVIGILELTSDDEKVTYSLTADRSHAGDTFRPTHLMEKVSEYLAEKNEPVPKSAVETKVTGKGEFVRTAIAVLVEEGFVTQTKGKQNAILLRFVRPYSEDEDVFEDDESSSQARPKLVPSLLSTPSFQARPPVPLRDGDELERTTSSQARPSSSRPELNDLCVAPGCSRPRMSGLDTCAFCFDAAVVA